MLFYAAAVATHLAGKRKHTRTRNCLVFEHSETGLQVSTSWVALLFISSAICRTVLDTSISHHVLYLGTLSLSVRPLDFPFASRMIYRDCQLLERAESCFREQPAIFASFVT